MELKALAMELRHNELGERKREGEVGFGFRERDHPCGGEWWRRSSLASAIEPS